MNIIEENKKLCKRYPFLIVRNVWTDKILDDYDYSWTRLDEVEDGWKDLFLRMCEEIREPLIKTNYLNNFRFSQIKEKWGRLCVYNFGAPKEVYDIINKYEILSAHTCIRCGTLATKISQSWICPYCDACAKRISDHERFISVGEWFKEDNDGNY